MEEGLFQIAATVAGAIELVMILVVAFGTVRALVALTRSLLKGEALAPHVREIWLHYAAWILLALEFALAADLIHTVVAPGWREVGQLGGIAIIRIALGYFLGHDIAEMKPEQDRASSRRDGMN